MSREIPFAASSNIAGITYDDEEQTLVVRFNKGGTYSYEGVPPNVADGFSSAPSAGTYLHQFVKGAYSYEKVG